jgi:hypothetical protein
MALKQQAHQLRFPSFPSSGLRTASPKLELLHSCVPKLELGNKVDTRANMLDIVRNLDLPREPRGRPGHEHRPPPLLGASEELLTCSTRRICIY